MKTAFVTGATGFIGSNLARILLERGRKVKALVRPTSDHSNIEGLDVEIVKGDLLDFASIERGMKGCEEVYHVAAEYRLWSDNRSKIYQANVEGTRNVMEAAKLNGASRIVYTSTVGTIGLPENILENSKHPANEEAWASEKQVKLGCYKHSKFEAEKVVLDYAIAGLPVVVVNPSAPVGAWDHRPTPTGQIIVDFVKGRMPAYLDTGLNLINVRDVAEGHVLAAEKGRVGQRYILGNENLSLSEILNRLSRITHQSAPKLKIPYPLAWMAGFVSTKVSDWVTHQPPAIALEGVKMARKFMYFDSTKALKELSLPQTPVDAALEEAVKWFQDRGYFN